MRLWRTWLAAGTLMIFTYLLVPSGLPHDIVYISLGFASVGAMYVGLRRNTPAYATPWYLFAGGLLTWVIGDSIYSWNLDVRHIEPFPSVADVFYLAAYPLFAAGITMLIRRRGATFDVAGTIDSAIVVAGIGLLSFSWVAEPILAADAVPALERGLAVAYPIADIVLLALLVRLVSAPGAPSTAFRLLVGAVSLQIVADSALAAAPSASWDYASVLDLLWLGSYVLWGASALHPQMSGLSRRPAYVRAVFTRRRMAALGLAALLPPVTALMAMASGRSIDAWGLAGGAIVLTTLVLARTGCAVGDLRIRTSQRDKLQDQVFHQAAHDGLTGLFNRAYMMRLIDGALRRGQATGASTGLVLIDLDKFKALNDSWGPSAGDTVLQEMARRIRDVTQDQHSAGRLGADQFVVLVDAPDAQARTTRLAEELLTKLRQPHSHQGHLIRVTPRIGLSVSLDGGTDGSQLLREALFANRRAKVSGTETFEVFDDYMRREHADRSETEASLRRAISDGGLELFYQPVVATTTRAVDGYEALVRWNVAGDVRMPAEFIPVAEGSELICELGRWVLSEATRQFAAWMAVDPERFGNLTVAVNISGRHLADSRIVDDVSAALEASGLPARHLAIEVTETVLVDVPQAVIQLSSLRAIGVTISLDDFGTGYTSIGQLRRLPIDTVKIDRSFFQSDEPGLSQLVALMIAAAHACGMRVVAEGIERLEQFDMLRTHDCDAAQGFLFSRPMPADSVIDYDGQASRPLLRFAEDR